MITQKQKYPRGSEWRQWDLHIHSPASFHWHGPRLPSDPNSDEHKRLIDEMIEALNDAQPAVFALMDYWTFDGWFALKRRLSQDGSPALRKKVFPGIELRLVAPMRGRLNAHALFSDETDDQILDDFLARLTVALVKRPLSKSALVDLARHHIGDDRLVAIGTSKRQVIESEESAYLAGAKCAEIIADSYRDALSAVPAGLAVGFMPFDTHDGLDQVKWAEHYAYVKDLLVASQVIEARDPCLRSAIVNEETPENEAWIANMQFSLGNVPRLVVSGSDAHRFRGNSGDNNCRGYGDFPSGKATWIKADPTFRGLLQAILEPAKRSFIGTCPTKLRVVEANKTYFIDSVAVEAKSRSAEVDVWLDGVNVPLNPDLVAIIGNKGSGKSALADIIALLGNSHQGENFSFLSPTRFRRGRNGDPARRFEGRLTWRDGHVETMNLAESPTKVKVEQVRYVPQGYFETLCNRTDGPEGNRFEQELRTVIFSHVDSKTRLEAGNFQALVDREERGIRERLAELRKNLHELNLEICGIEEKMGPGARTALVERRKLKELQIDEHRKLAPLPHPEPAAEPNEGQHAASARLDEIGKSLECVAQRKSSFEVSRLLVAKKLRAIAALTERGELLERTWRKFRTDSEKDLELVGLSSDEWARLMIDWSVLNSRKALIETEERDLEKEDKKLDESKSSLEKEREELTTKLNRPQLEYQHYLRQIEEWNGRLAILQGAANVPDSLIGLEEQIRQCDRLPEERQARLSARSALAREIFHALDLQRMKRADLYAPVQQIVQENALIREEYGLQFEATLTTSAARISEMLFRLVKQTSGDFRGSDEAELAVKKLVEGRDFGKEDDFIAFVDDLRMRIEGAAGSGEGIGVAGALRKGVGGSDVYDMLYGATFIEPRYSLKFQGASIDQLSPGQRGALLLIFYLLVDKGHNPIVLDQPEENLDNETVVGLLVPVVAEAKKRRQVIIVTHNPNLGVVCDAEQIVHATLDLSNGKRISYRSGSIEDPEVNPCVVDVLEGTMPAFNNRRGKYH